jgi:hypothetical protein
MASLASSRPVPISVSLEPTPADPATSLYIKTCQGTKPGVREDLLQSSATRRQAVSAKAGAA